MEDSTNILIVDDDKAIANFLSKILIKSEDNDYNVAVTHTAEDGLHLIEENNYDIVILDVNLPGKSGIEFLTEIKGVDPDVEVIVMTGDAKIETAIDALREGAYDYLQKPFTQEQVVTTIRNAYQKRRLTLEKRELINNLSDVNDQLEKANQMLAEKKAIVDKELEKKVEDLTNINLFVKGITPQLDLIKLMNIIPRFLIDLFGFKGAAIITFSSNNFIVHASLETGNDFKKGDIFSKDNPMINKIIKPPVVKEIGKLTEDGLNYISMPVKSGNKLLGVLIVGSDMDEPLKYYGEDLFSTIAGNVALAMQNAVYFENSRKNYLESLYSFLIILETEDPSLREHAERVSNVATKIAKQLNLDDSVVTNVRYAGLIHDIGRVGSIRTSPKDGLKEKIMKIHQNTEKIIKPVSFLAQGLEYIHYMFENFDGSGFPDGKAGDDIPVGARILAIANAYDEIYMQLKDKGKEPDKDTILAQLSSHIGVELDPRLFAILQGIEL